MSREAYLRIVLHVEGVEYILGLEWRDSDELGSLRVLTRIRMKTATQGIPPGRYAVVAAALERMVVKHWPDRAYFVEVGHDSDNWVQIFDPKGFVRKGG